MAPNSGSASKQKKKTNGPLKKSGSKLKKKLSSSPGKRVKTQLKKSVSKSNNNIPSVNGKSCHQCQHPSNKCAEAWCMDQTNNKACTAMYCERCLRNRYGEKAEEVANLADWSCPKCRGICNCSICMKRRGLQPTGRLFGIKKATGYSSVSAMLIRERKVVPDVVATPKEELTRVAGIDVPSEHVANALQFLEFCSVFGKILDVKKGEPEYVLQNLLEGETGRRGKLSATAQFQIHILSLIQNERGEKSAELNPSYRKSSWFNVLKKCLSESQRVLKAQGLDSLDVETDYETLAASEKLKFLIFLCDEILGTEKVRNWLGDQKASEAKQKLLSAKNREKGLKDDEDKAINDRNQISEILLVEPVFIGRGDIGRGDTLSLNEKWSSIDDKGKEAIEKYICCLWG